MGLYIWLWRVTNVGLIVLMFISAGGYYSDGAYDATLKQ